MDKRTRYSIEVRERAVRLVLDHERAHPSQWAAIRSVAEKIGCTPETLRKWVRRAERDEGRRPGLTTGEQQRVLELERENRELRRTNEICERRPRISRRRSSTADRSDGVVHRRAAQRCSEAGDRTSLGAELRGLRREEGLEAAEPRRAEGGTLHGRALDARTGTQRGGSRTRIRDHHAVWR